MLQRSATGPAHAARSVSGSHDAGQQGRAGLTQDLPRHQGQGGVLSKQEQAVTKPAHTIKSGHCCVNTTCSQQRSDHRLSSANCAVDCEQLVPHSERSTCSRGLQICLLWWGHLASGPLQQASSGSKRGSTSSRPAPRQAMHLAECKTSTISFVLSARCVRTRVAGTGKP